jgi:hypothetical protein
LPSGSALARAEATLAKVAGTAVTNDQLIDAFLRLREDFIKSRERPDSVEARAYLRKHKKGAVFAANQFTREQAIEFVEGLYAAGAVRVMIENISHDHESQDGGPHADSMTVELPQDGDARARVFSVINTVGEPEDTPFVDDGEPQVGLWWD